MSPRVWASCRLKKAPPECEPGSCDGPLSGVKSNPLAPGALSASRRVQMGIQRLDSRALRRIGRLPRLLKPPIDRCAESAQELGDGPPVGRSVEAQIHRRGGTPDSATRLASRP